MKPTLVDTDILSMYFRGDERVEANVEQYIEEYGKVNLSIITYYEIVSGLTFRDTRKQRASFLAFAKEHSVLPLTEHAAATAAELYAALRKKGQPIDDIDLLIAGIALSNDLILATNNERHFERIEALEVVNWSKE